MTDEKPPAKWQPTPEDLEVIRKAKEFLRKPRSPNAKVVSPDKFDDPLALRPVDPGTRKRFIAIVKKGRPSGPKK
jgi:hypothetical protein